MAEQHFNGLHPAEAERLALLIEECGEVVQAASKVLRHGYKSYDPTVRGGPDNQEALAKEIVMFEAVPDCGGPEFIPSRFDHRRCPGCQGWLDLHHIGCPIARCREAITREEADRRLTTSGGNRCRVCGKEDCPRDHGP